MISHVYGTFTDIYWPFLKPYILQAVDVENWSPEFFVKFLDSDNWPNIALAIGLVVIILFLTMLSNAYEEGKMAIFFGGSEKHRGFFTIVGTMVVINLMTPVYRVMEQAVNSIVFHAQINVVEENMAGVFNPLGILLLTVAIMHGFMDEGVEAWLFTACTLLFPFVYSEESRTSTQWILLLLELAAAIIMAGIFSGKRYVYSGYLAFSIFLYAVLVMQGLNTLMMPEGFVELVGLLGEETVRTETIPYVLSCLHGDIVLSIGIFVILILFERLFVNSARDVKAAMRST